MYFMLRVDLILDDLHQMEQGALGRHFDAQALVGSAWQGDWRLGAGFEV